MNNEERIENSLKLKALEIIKKYAEATAKPAPEQEKVELGNGAGKLT